MNFSQAQKIYIFNKSKIWVVFILVVTGFLLDIIWLIRNYHVFKFEYVSITIFLLRAFSLVIFGYLILKLLDLFFDYVDSKIDKWSKIAEKAELGIEGEDKVFDFLSNILDKEKFYFFRNIKLPDKKTDIDLVLVGVGKGVYTVEVKNFLDSNYIFENDRVYYKKTNGLLGTLYKDIRRIVAWRAKELDKFLFNKGIDEYFPIYKVIVGVNGNSFKVINNDTEYKVQVRNLENLKTYFDQTKENSKFTQEFCLKIVEVISKIKLPEVMTVTKVGSSVNFLK
jgi:hypothetical protein